MQEMWVWSPGEGNDNLFQCSCLGNPMDRGTWRATVHGVTKSQTWLNNNKINTILRIGSLLWILRGQGAELGCWVAVGSSSQRDGTGIKLGSLQSAEQWFPEVFLIPKMSPYAWRILVELYSALPSLPTRGTSRIKTFKYKIKYQSFIFIWRSP